MTSLPPDCAQASTLETSSLTTAIRLAAILYDLDGTLVNTDPFHYRVWRDMLDEHGLAIDEAFYKNHISGRLNPAIVEALLPQMVPDAAEQFIVQKEARFRSLTPQLTPMPGLSDLLAWATVQNLKQAVVTNAPTENVHHALKALGLETTFDQVVIADELGIGKPDPAPYQHALQQFSILPEQAVAFEDSPSGVRSAVAAGILTIGVASTHDPERLYAVGATLVIPDFTAPDLWVCLRQRVVAELKMQN